MKRLTVLISDTGTGTNLQAIIDAIEAKKLKDSYIHLKYAVINNA